MGSLPHRAPSFGNADSMTTKTHPTDEIRPDRVPEMLLERDQQLDALHESLNRTGSDGGKVVLIRGEAGIGKSALVHSFLRELPEQVDRLLGYCDDLLTPHPLGPFWDLAREAPTLVQPLEAGDRIGVLQATLDLLAREIRSTVIVIEDTQWADDATIDAIRYVGRRISRTNGLLALTFRETEVSDSHPLRRVLGELDPTSIQRIRLSSLSPSSVAALVRTSGAPLDPDDVYAMTDGNPLFATELVTSWKVGLPVSIRDSVMARAAKLSPRATKLLNLASVVPGEFPIEGLLRMSGATIGELRECSAQGLLDIDGSVVLFRHELTRRAIESALSEPERRQMNQKVLDGLLPDGDLARIVHHARGAANADALVEFGPKAARAAAAMRSYQEAVANFRAVEPYLERLPNRDRAAFYSDWADIAAHQHDDPVEVLRILTRAIERYRVLGDDFGLARSLVLAAQFNDDAGRPDAVDECINEALRVLSEHPPSPGLCEALGRKAFILLRRGDAASADALADESLALAERLGERRAGFSAMNAKGLLRYASGDQAGLRLLEEARLLARDLGDDVEETRAVLNSGYACLVLQEFALAIDFFDRAREIAIQANLASEERLVSEGLAKALFFLGEWDRAEELAVQDSSRAYSNLATPTFNHIRARLAIRKGLPNAADQLLEAWSDAENRMSLARGHLATARAEHMWITGDLDADLSALLQGRASEYEDNNPWGAEISFWLWLAGDRARPVEEIPEPYGQAVRGEPSAAAHRFEELGMPYEQAIALCLSDEHDALEGLELLEELGAIASARRCRQMLRDRGFHVPRGRGRRTREHPAGLTTRQSEVLELLAEDLTDAEIADRLFVSTRTINHHVSAVLGKLGVSNRSEAADRASSLGLLS